MTHLNLFELEYNWFDGEHSSYILATTKEQHEIEKDLKEIAESVKIDEIDEIGSPSVIDCLPTAYDRIIDALVEKGYIICTFVDDPLYKVELRDNKTDKQCAVYEIKHKTIKIKWKGLQDTEK